MWTALGCLVSWEETLERELADCLGGPAHVYVPRHIVEFYHGRKSRIVTRQQLLMPGYLMVDDPEVRLDKLNHGERAWVLRGANGRALPLPQATVAEFMLRQISGKFDIRAHRGGDPLPVMPKLRERVKVLALNWIGTVVTLFARWAEVKLDGINKTVLVVPAGMESIQVGKDPIYRPKTSMVLG